MAKLPLVREVDTNVLVHFNVVPIKEELNHSDFCFIIHNIVKPFLVATKA